MTPDRLARITARYPDLRIAIVGDFCLDRYLEIDPTKQEVSIETGLPVHNVVNVRAQPGGAGTILNNLSALGVGTIHPIGLRGDDGEGYELERALRATPGVRIESLLVAPGRHTFTYCKPLAITPGTPPVELSRLDTKSWTETPEEVQAELIRRVEQRAPELDALILLDQVSLPETGVVTSRLLQAIAKLNKAHPQLWVLADSRRGLRNFPPVGFKMNRDELAALHDVPESLPRDRILSLAGELARRNHSPVFVTLAEEGMVGANAEGRAEYSPALPVRGPIDIVGAGDCVTANLTTALAAGASIIEAMHIAQAAASHVIHQLGTTGTASPEQIAAVLGLLNRGK